MLHLHLQLVLIIRTITKKLKPAISGVSPSQMIFWEFSKQRRHKYDELFLGLCLCNYLSAAFITAVECCIYVYEALI